MTCGAYGSYNRGEKKIVTIKYNVSLLSKKLSPNAVNKASTQDMHFQS